MHLFIPKIKKIGQNEINIDSGQFKGADSENDTPEVQKSKNR